MDAVHIHSVNGGAWTCGRCCHTTLTNYTKRHEIATRGSCAVLIMIIVAPRLETCIASRLYREGTSASAAAVMEELQDGQERDYKFMKKAVDEAYSAIDCGDGRPFGAVIIRDDDPLAICHNMVLRNSDPSAHAEVTAIRAACKRLGKIDLSDCEIYSSCQPCPMCMAAIHFSKIKNVVYGAKVEVAVAAGFSGFIPEAFVEYYRKSGMEIRQVEGDAARIAEEVFEKVKSSG